MNKKHEEIKTEYMDLLIFILRGINTSSKMAKKLKLPRKTISNRLIALEKKGYISKNIIHNSRPFELTSKGNEATAISLSTLSGNSGMPKGTLKAHKVTWVMDITRKPYELNDELKKNAYVVSKHNNWFKYTKKYEDMKIVFNPKKVYFYLNCFYIDNPLEYYDIAVEKVRKAKKFLEEKFPGLTLGDPLKQMVCKSNHIVKQYGPLARKFYEESIKQGKPIVYHGSHLNVDFSDGPPEEETVDPVTAPQDMFNLGEFFNDWIQKPITINDLHKNSNDLDKIKEDIKEKIERGDQDFKGIIGRLQDSQKSLIDMQQSQKDIIRLADKSVQGNEELKGYLAKFFLSQEVFATAMHEHVALIKTLQVLAENHKSGLDNIMVFLKDFLISFTKKSQDRDEQNLKDFKKREEQIIKNFEKREEIMLKNQENMFSKLIDNTTPWYIRLSNFVKRRLGGDKNKKDKL